MATDFESLICGVDDLKKAASVSTSTRGYESYIGFSNTISDGANNLSEPQNRYYEAIEFEVLTENISLSKDKIYYNGEVTPIGEAFSYSRATSKNLKIPEGSAISNTTSRDFFGLYADTLSIDGTIAQVVSHGISPIGFSGGGSTGLIEPTSGTNMMLNFWNYMPKGGNGGKYDSSQPTTGAGGGYGFSGGGTGNDGNWSIRGGNGGAFILIVANEIYGIGTIEAKGGIPSYTTNVGNYGGGGMVLILTASWSGTVGIDVTTPVTTFGATHGSYAIMKINTDGSLTLMVYSENGVSADLNGQTPVHGADASIAW